MYKGIFAAIALLLPINLYAITEVVKTIREDGTGNYTSLAAWEAAENKDLVAADQIAVARIEGSWSSPGSNVLISGWTTDSTHYIRIYTAPDARHSGVWNDTKFRMTSNGTVLNVQVPYTRIEGLQISAGVIDDVLQHGINGNSGGQTGIWISNCIIRLSSAVVNYSYAQGISLAEGGIGKARIFNNIVYGFKTANNTANYGIYVSLIDNPALVYNNTVVGCHVGYGGVWGRTVTPKNNIAQDCNIGYYDVSGGNNNLTSLGDAPGSNSVQGATVAFVDAANRNYHLASNDAAARFAGVDLSTDPYLPLSTDIDGEARTASWDIGADEVPGSGGDAANPSVSGVTVAGAPTVNFGSVRRISWTTSDDIGVVRCSLWVSLNGGTSYTFIAETTAASITGGAKNWTVPNSATTSAQIRVRAYDAAGKNGEAVSALFTIADPAIATSVMLVRPNGSETWPANSQQTINWTTEGTNTVLACSLFYTIDGTTWNFIGGTSGNPSAYGWQVPQLSSSMCLVKILVRDAAGKTATDVSDNPFSIVRNPFITSPDSVFVAPGGNLNYQFSFNAEGYPGQPNFELLNAASLPYSVGLVGTLVFSNGVTAAPNPRVDTIRVRFSVGDFQQEFKLRVMVGTPVLGIASGVTKAQALSLAVEQTKNKVTFLVRIDNAGPCEISIYDVAGRQVWSRDIARALPGSFSLSWNSASAPKSIYIAQLRSNGRSMRRIFWMNK